MPLHLTWQDVIVRLVLTLVAGLIIGINRGERGRAAGLRTIVLVCLAASGAMIQANLLLDLSGRAPDSFIMLDLMRLPLGILSGMGFIGAGAILRRGEMIVGITTAATLWFVTVLGLCIGGGQIGLGMALLVAGLLVLSPLRWAEQYLPQDQRAVLLLTLSSEGLSEQELRDLLASARLRVLSTKVSYLPRQQLRRLEFRVHWRAPARDTGLPPMLERLADLPGMQRLEWQPAA